MLSLIALAPAKQVRISPKRVPEADIRAALQKQGLKPLSIPYLITFMVIQQCRYNPPAVWLLVFVNILSFIGFGATACGIGYLAVEGVILLLLPTTIGQLLFFSAKLGSVGLLWALSSMVYKTSNSGLNEKAYIWDSSVHTNVSELNLPPHVYDAVQRLKLDLSQRRFVYWFLREDPILGIKGDDHCYYLWAWDATP